MSIYRKDNNGNIKKIAGLFIKTYNTKWFNVTRSIENDLEIYTLNNEDLEYFEYIQTRSIFNLNFTEPNTTTTPKLRIGTRTFDIYSLINATGEISVGILSSIVQFYFGATLDNNRVYIYTNNIEDGAITTSKIANSAVTEEKLSTDIQTILLNVEKIIDGSIPAAKATADANGANLANTYATKTELNSETSARQSADSTLQDNIGAKYTKPTSGIPETDLSLDVQQKLNSGGGGGGDASIEWLSSTEYDSVWNNIVFDKAFNNADVLDISVMLQGTLTYNEQTYMAIVFVEGGVSVNDAFNIAQTWTQGYALPAGGDMSSTFPIAGMFFLKHSDGSKKVGWQFTIQFVNNSAVSSPAATDFKVDAIGRANILIK